MQIDIGQQRAAFTALYGVPLVGVQRCNPLTMSCSSQPPDSTLLDYMITMFKVRHSGRDCRNPGAMDGFELTIHGAGYPLPGEYDELAII
ncbi:MAG: hypothetical protein ACRD9S_26355 [Pyrinomonadaceae bacterium]